MSIYTMKDWTRDGTFKAEPGQEIDAQLYETMQNAVPPRAIPKETAARAWELYRVPVHAGFLMGQQETTDEDGTPLFLAFGSNDYGKGAHYYYLGLSKPYKRLHGTYYYFDCMNAFVNDGLFPAREFKDDAEAIRYAADYEATLIKYEYKEGERISSAVIYQPMFL